MKKSLFLATTGIAGVLLFAPQSDAKAELNVHISMGNRSPVLVVSNYPDFIYLDDYGFYVSYGWDYDLIRFGDFYFVFRDGNWYRASYYRGPWRLVRYYDLPWQIRRHKWNDIWHRRDYEYRRHDRSYWDRHFREQRIRDNRDLRDRRPDERPNFRPDGRKDFKPEGRLDTKPDFRQDFRKDRRSDDKKDGKPDFKSDGRFNNNPDYRNNDNKRDFKPRIQSDQEQKRSFDRGDKNDDGKRKDRDRDRDNDRNRDRYRDYR